MNANLKLSTRFMPGLRGQICDNAWYLNGLILFSLAVLHKAVSACLKIVA